MKSSQLGSTTSPITVVDISPDGIWVHVRGEEIFLEFDEFPWFKKGTVEQILNVVEESENAFHWPDLDIDLDLDRMRHPEKYPLKAKPVA